MSLLVESGVVERRAYAAGRFGHVLTDAGLELWPVLFQMMQGGERHLVVGARARVFSHVACGSVLASDGRCSSCQTVPSPGDVEMRPGSATPRMVRDDPVSVALRRPRRLLTPVDVQVGLAAPM